MTRRLHLVETTPPPAPADATAGEAAVAASPEQVEMPFAVVHGEPITQLPRDLYIPPQALEVFLEAFEGPLDLLLYLIRRQNVDILDIPIAEITRQYTQYIELMQDLQLELAGEYLVMAATLAEIKSRMLLPRSESATDSEDDPRAELVRRLQEYERFGRWRACCRRSRCRRCCSPSGRWRRAHRCSRTTTCGARACRCASA